MKVDDLIAAGETMNEALGREYYLTWAGLKTDAQFQAIYDRFAHLVSDEALDAARSSGSPPLIEWVVGARIERRVAALDERQLAWERDATVRVGERTIPYLRAPIELANSPDRAFRIALDEARARAGAEGLNGLRKERFQREHETVGELGFGDYPSGVAALSGMDLDTLALSAAVFLDETKDLYADALERLVHRRLKLSVDDLVRADAAWAFRADRFDRAFPPGNLAERADSQMREMGLDATQGGRIRFDTDERTAKQPRAFCVPVRVPDEVYLVQRPRGGHQDYRTFWHELGHAMHFAGIDPAMPFAARWLGDNSVTEGFAMLWDHQTLEPAWLARYAGLSAGDARDLGFELAVSELHLIRRYAGKLGYELWLHRGHLDRPGDEYASRLTEATLFRYPPDECLLDVDPGFYAARYLRAWQLEAALARELTQRFDTDWYRNPRAGAFILDLMRRGQEEPADRLAVVAVGTALSFEPVMERLLPILE